MILTSADWASTACSKKSAWVHRGGQLGVHEREIKWNQVEIKRNFDLMVHHCCLKIVQRCYPEKQWWWKHEAIFAKISTIIIAIGVLTFPTGQTGSPKEESDWLPGFDDIFRSWETRSQMETLSTTFFLNASLFPLCTFLPLSPSPSMCNTFCP